MKKIICYYCHNITNEKKEVDIPMIDFLVSANRVYIQRVLDNDRSSLVVNYGDQTYVLIAGQAYIVQRIEKTLAKVDSENPLYSLDRVLGVSDWNKPLASGTFYYEGSEEDFVEELELHGFKIGS